MLRSSWGFAYVRFDVPAKVLFQPVQRYAAINEEEVRFLYCDMRVYVFEADVFVQAVLEALGAVSEYRERGMTIVVVVDTDELVELLNVGVLAGYFAVIPVVVGQHPLNGALVNNEKLARFIDPDAEGGLSLAHEELNAKAIAALHRRDRLGFEIIFALKQAAATGEQHVKGCQLLIFVHQKGVFVQVTDPQTPRQH